MVVERFRGPTNGASIARAGVISVLEAENSVDLLSVRALEAFESELDGSPRGYAKVIRELDVSGVVRGKLTRTDDGYRLRLSFVGPDGKSRGDVVYDDKSPAALRRRIESSFWVDLAPLLESSASGVRASPGREDEEQEGGESATERPEKAETKGEGDEEVARSSTEPPDPKRSLRCARWQFNLGSGAARRTFVYVDEQPGPLRGYRSTAFPLASIGAGVYPFASADCDGWSGLGVEVRFEYLMTPPSRLGSRELSTLALSGEAELVYRRSWGAFWLEPRTGYAARRFEVETDVVADAVYNALRFGLRTGIAPGPFRLDLGASYDWVLLAEQLMLPDWFPRARGFGYELRASIGWALGKNVELMLTGKQVRYSFDLSPGGAHPYVHGVAAGAEEEYVNGALEARFLIR